MGRVRWALLTLVGFVRSRAATDDEKARECEADFRREFGLGILEGVERSMGPFRVRTLPANNTCSHGSAACEGARAADGTDDPGRCKTHSRCA